MNRITAHGLIAEAISARRYIVVITGTTREAKAALHEVKAQADASGLNGRLDLVLANGSERADFSNGSSIRFVAIATTSPAAAALGPRKADLVYIDIERSWSSDLLRRSLRDIRDEGVEVLRA